MRQYHTPPAAGNMGSLLLSRNALRDDVASVVSSIGGHARLFTSCHCVLAPPGIPVKAREDNANGDNILKVVKLSWGICGHVAP